MEIAGFITSGLISKVQDLVIEKVIGKWKAHRASKFFETLTLELTREYSSQQETNNLDSLIEKVLTKPESEELLFEAYRRVCLSTTKDLGPKIIAILTARLLIEERIATEDEESIFVLAEEMRDVEFIDFCNFFVKEELEANLLKGNLSHSISSDSLDLGSSDRSSTTHLTPIIMLGKWAGKLERVGFLYADTISENYMESNFDNESKPVIRYSFYVNFERSVIPLYHYIRRAQGPRD